MPGSWVDGHLRLWHRATQLVSLAPHVKPPISYALDDKYLWPQGWRQWAP
jgi:hypothetical protein